MIFLLRDNYYYWILPHLEFTLSPYFISIICNINTLHWCWNVFGGYVISLIQVIVFLVCGLYSLWHQFTHNLPDICLAVQLTSVMFIFRHCLCTTIISLQILKLSFFQFLCRHL